MNNTSATVGVNPRAIDMPVENIVNFNISSVVPQPKARFTPGSNNMADHMDQSLDMPAGMNLADGLGFSGSQTARGMENSGGVCDEYQVR